MQRQEMLHIYLFIYCYLFITFGDSQAKPNIEQAIN